MPRIQVLEKGTPSFSEQLGQALGQGGQALGQGLSAGIQQHLQSKENEKQLSAFTPFLKSINLNDDEISSFIKSGLPPKLAIEAIKIQANKKATESAQNADYGKILDNLDNLLDESGVGFSGAFKRPFSEDARENAANFQAQATALLGLAQKVALKRGITNQREFQAFLDRTVPNANDTIGTARGKLKALRNYLKDEDGEISAIKSTSESTNNKLEKGASLGDKLPDPSTHKNLIVRKGDKRYVSTGSTWRELK